MVEAKILYNRSQTFPVIFQLSLEAKENKKRLFPANYSGDTQSSIWLRNSFRFASQGKQQTWHKHEIHATENMKFNAQETMA